MNFAGTNRNQILALLLSILFLFAADARSAINGKIAFASDRDGNSEIYVMNADGTGQVRLTNNPGVDDFPAWSPDGKRLAFLSTSASGGYFVKLMNADGTGQTELTTSSPYVSLRTWYSLDWSPNGDKIVFQDNGYIYTINTDGTGRRILRDGFEPVWSPDANRIAFSAGPGIQPWVTHVYIMNADGSNLIAMPAVDGSYWSDFAPGWLPDGNQIALATDDFIDGSWIRLMNADGTNIRFLPFLDDVDSPHWSPDGAKIVYSFWHTNGKQIYTISVNGEGNTRLTDGPDWNYHPSWQPLVAGVSSVSGRLVTSDGRGLRNATVSMTDSFGVSHSVTTSSFGFFTFDSVITGGTCTFNVSSRLYRFIPQTVQITDNLTLADFVGLE